jgi:hypothetical protein
MSAMARQDLFTGSFTIDVAEFDTCRKTLSRFASLIFLNQRVLLQCIRIHLQAYRSRFRYAGTAFVYACIVHVFQKKEAY